MKSTQHDLQVLLDSCVSKEVRNSSSLCHTAWLNTVSTPHSGAWIMALPNTNLGLAVSTQEFMVTLRVWLGILVFLHCQSVICPCGTIINPHGNHVLECGFRALRIVTSFIMQFLWITMIVEANNTAVVTTIQDLVTSSILTFHHGRVAYFN